jgi:hypothetical protein
VAILHHENIKIKIENAERMYSMLAFFSSEFLSRITASFGYFARYK